MPQYDYEKMLDSIDNQREGLPPAPVPPVTAPANPALDTLGLNLQRAATSNPMDEAKRRKLSGELGVPAAILPPTAQAEEQAFLKNAKAQEIMTKYPGLAKWAQNPTNAAVAGKDMLTLGEIETTARSLPSMTDSVLGVGKNLAGSAAAAFPSANAAIWSFVQAAGSILSTNVTKPLADTVGSPDLGEMLRSTAGDFRNRQLGMAKDIGPNLSGMSTLERGLYSGVQSAASTLMLLPLSVATGSPAPILAGLSGITAGTALGEATDKGLPLNEALIHATKQGLIEYGTELFPVGNLLKNLTGKTGLLKTATQFMVREGIGEQAATALQDLDKWATLHPEKPFSDYLAERPEAALETLIATAVGGSIQVGGAKAVARGMGMMQHHSVVELGRAQSAEEHHLAIQQLGAMAASHPLRERDPAAFHEFIETMAEDGNLSDVYVDGKVLSGVFNQSGITEDELRRKMPELVQQLGEAVKTNGEVRISLADYATYVAGTDVEKGLLDHLRASPEGMTYTEAQQFYKGQKDDLTKQAEKLMADTATSEEYQADVQKVHDTILEQMNKAGRFTPEVNAAYAVPFREFYVVNAAKMGMTPSELYKQLPLNFAPMNTGNILNQEEPTQIKALSKDEMIARGADGHLAKAYERYIPIDKLTGLEPVPANNDSDDGTYKPGRQIEQPIEVTFNVESGEYVVYGGNHRIAQAKANGQKHILAFVEGEDHKSRMHLLSHGSRKNPDVNVLNQSVFHGTPHVWAPEPGFPHGRPRLDKMGTGEGAQAFGWGWYSAENQGIAKGYQEGLVKTKTSKADQILVDGVPLSTTGVHPMVASKMLMLLTASNGNVAEALGTYEGKTLDKFNTDVKGGLEKIKGTVTIAPPPEGSLYSLDIPDSVLPRLLDWDKPLSEQTPEVRKALAELADKYGYEYGDNYTGAEAYRALTSDANAEGLNNGGDAQKAAAELLADVGIVGNRYLDGGSRADGKGTYNYVLWDQATIDKVALLERNGEKLDAMRELAQSPTQTETAAFKSWFGDSKVVDSDGKPLVVYHGTADEITDFQVGGTYREGHGKMMSGIYFSEYENTARSYSRTAVNRKDMTKDHYGVVIPAYVSLKNPKFFDDVDKFQKASREKLQSQGYDGAIRLNPFGDKVEVVAFSPEQIKSATGNSGAFDPNNPSILEQNNRAGYNPDTFTISLLKGADLSSTLHEGGHFYLEALADLASRPEAPQQIKDDFRKTLDWFGITGNENLEAGTRGADLGQSPLNENFRKWFGDSKVVDADGKPLVVYHGTLADFSTFELGRGEAQSTAFFFTNKENVNGYLTSYLDQQKYQQETRDGDHTIMPVYVSLKNPKRIDTTDTGEWADPDSENAAIVKAKKEGHDGLIVTDGSMDTVFYVAFNPEQIKSATGNSGAFNPNDPNILNQGGDPGTPGELPPGRTPEEVWNSMSLDQKRPYHEQWAQSFERYMIEGKAPTTELQPVFARFRAWMLNVYKSLESFLKQNPLAGKLNDEVRGIFDRLLAAEDSIRATESVRGYAPLFKDAETAGVTPKQYQDYLALGEQATQQAIDDLSSRGLRDMKWLSNAKEKVIKELQGEAKAKRKVVEDEVRREVMAEPVEVARTFLKTGEMTDPETGDLIKAEAGFKLDSNAVAELFPETGPVTLDKAKLRGMTAKDGLSPDLAAQMFGFSSGEALILELSHGDSAKAKIEAMTDQRMLERHGELSSEEDIERAAEAAIHNEARAKFMATGLKILMKSAIPASQISKAAKAAAENTIASRKVRDLRPGQYQRAESAANKEALKLAGKDPQGAVQAQRAALLNNRLAKAAAEATREVEKILRYVGKFQNEGTRKGLDVEYMEQIDDLLRPFDFRKGVSLKQIDKRQSLTDWVSEQEALGFEPAIDPSKLDEAKLKSYKNMTMEELRGFVDSIKQVEHLGRLKKKLLLAKDEREFDAVVLDGVESIEKNANRTVEEKATPTDAIGIMGKWWRQMTADHRKFASIMREMDGGKDNGFMFNYFLKTMNQAGDNETQMKAEATEALAKLFNQIKRDPVTGNLYAKKRMVPGTSLSMTHEQRIMFAMNWGNEGNRQRLLDGGLSGNRALSMPQAEAVLDTLTKEEWDFVQGVWDYIAGYKDQVAALERRLTGIEPQWIEPAAIQTKYGTYKGGYFPVKYDAELSSRSESFEAATDLRMGMKGAFNASATRNGFTKARAEAVINRPVLLSYNAVAQHVSEVTHRLSWQEWLVDTNRLLKALDNPIREHYGAEILRTLRDTVVDIATGDAPAKNGTETAINRLRVGSTVVGMGWRVTTALLQPSGLAQSWVRVGGKYMARGVRQFTKSPITSGEFVNGKSKMMTDRGRTMQREINEVLNTIRAGDKVSAFKASYFTMIGKMQRMVDIPTWLGAYEKATDQLNLQDASTADERARIEEQAAALADQAVLDSQSGGQLKDLAKVQRGSPLQKIFTNFYSYFSATYNLNVEAVRRTSFKSPSQVAMLATDMVLLNSVPVLFSVALKELLKGECGDDLECLAKKLGHEQLSFLFGQMVLLREAGVAIDAATGGQGFGYQGPAGLRFFADLYKTGQQINQGEADMAFFKSANQVAGAILHYPAGQVNATMEGIMAIEEGKVEGVDIIKALVVGPPKK